MADKFLTDFVWPQLFVAVFAEEFILYRGFDKSTDTNVRILCKAFYTYISNVLFGSKACSGVVQGGRGPSPQSSRQNIGIRLNCTKLANLVSVK